MTTTRQVKYRDKVRAHRKLRAAATVALTMASLLAVALRPMAQSAGPSAMAAKLTGRWALNVELTPASGKPGRGRASFAVSGAPMQRGGRGGGGGQPGSEATAPLKAEEVAAQAALSVLHQVPMAMTIEATAETITFREPRGEWRFAIDGKTSVMAVPGGTLRNKSTWDRGTLRQEFSSAQRKLVKSWTLDANDRLVLTEKLESITLNSESKAVFDRQ
jgi:hypothetical protein